MYESQDTVPAAEGSERRRYKLVSYLQQHQAHLSFSEPLRKYTFGCVEDLFPSQCLGIPQLASYPC